MKKIVMMLAAATTVCVASAQNKTAKKPGSTNTKPTTAKSATSANSKPATVVLKNLKDSASYALGVNIARNLKQQDLQETDLEVMMKGMKEIFEDKKPTVSDDALNKSIGDFMQKGKEAKLGPNKEKGKKFLAENGKRNGVVTLPSGLQYEVLKAGTDTAKPKLTDKVKCHYHGTLIDGTIFDSSVDRGEPASFPLNGVIKGWQEALQLMTVGSKWKIYLPSDLAYGDNAAGEKIGPGSTLVFEVELLAIEKMETGGSHDGHNH